VQFLFLTNILFQMTPVQPKKIRRKRSAGEITVEQSSDFSLPAELFKLAGFNCPGSESGCFFLIGYCGVEPAGIAALQSEVDIAVIRCLLVLEPFRGRGLGAALVRAARIAANTRGARTLYARVPISAADYVARFGFKRVQALPGATAAFDAVSEPAEPSTFAVDISGDGLIER
jgi:GNAT superfamily N-acetyltransferase